MGSKEYGLVLLGDENVIRDGYSRLDRQPVDQEFPSTDGMALPEKETQLTRDVSVTGPGTFFKLASRTLTFRPTTERGWWLRRTDLPDAMPIRVTVMNVWTTARNIVLCSGSPHNYVRMVEHIVALRCMGLDNVVIDLESGDPPLFDRSSMDLVEAVDRGGMVARAERASYVTVREPVSVAAPNGGFLTFHPAESGDRNLYVDCAVHFPSAIGKQRIRFMNTPASFRYGAQARTNTTFLMMFYCKTFGKLFADTRNLGYTPRNILIAGRRRYFNKPGMLHNGKSLEAVWHRAVLDLLAAVALIDKGRLAGRIVSYKAGHALDVQMVRELYDRDMLVSL